MPSSRPNTIPVVVHVVTQLAPESILDVGVGFGKWGHLFREYTDITASETEPARYRKEGWRVRIEGIEGYPDYLTPMHEFLYDRIHTGDAAALLPTLGPYDIVFLGDIIEHFEKPQGMEVLRAACKVARKAVIVSTPRYETHQDDRCANELERHRSLWSAADFRAIADFHVTAVDRTTLLAVYTAPGVRPPVLRAPRAGGPRRVRAALETVAVRLLGRERVAGLVRRWRGNGKPR